MVDLQLAGYVTITGLLRARSGIRIGGSREELEIGGVDSPILRDPTDKLPYIPGSSIKGKLRSLLEYKYKRVGWRRTWNNDTRQEQLTQHESGGDPCGCGQPLDKCPVCTIFGAHKNPNHSLGPSRIIVRDALLNEKSTGLLEEMASDDSANLSNSN